MKKRIGSVLLALALCLSLLPATALAAGGTTNNVAEVSTKAELNAALSNVSVTEIHIIADMTYNDPLVASKPVQVNEDVTLTLNDYDTTVSGTIINNGTIRVKSGWKCLWKAETSGSGKLIGGTDSWGDPSTYVDYGCVPETMLDGCRINIVKNISQSVTAALPDPMQTGDTIKVTFSNLIESVDPAKVFNFVWKNGSSSIIYDGQATPTLTQSGTLKLSLTPKKPYVMCTSSGTMGSLDAQGTVTQKLLDTIYVDQTNGNNSNLGDTAAQPVKSIDKALDKITDGGTIVLLSNYSSRIVFDKSVTVKCEDGKHFALTSSSPNYVSDGVIVTLEKLNFSDSNFCKNTQGTGSLVFTNCIGSLSIGTGDISSITINNSQLSGNVSATETLTMTNSTFSGKFNTNNFASNGNNTLTCQKNSPSRIDGTVSAGTPVKIIPFSAVQPGDKLLEVSKSSDQTVTNHFVLADTQNNKYGIQLSKQYNGTYLCLAQRIENVKIAVGNEPAINHVPGDSVYIRSESGSGASIASANWSKTTTGWSAEETPKLTVTLKANENYFFDSNFSVNDLQVYSWADISKPASFEDAAKNSDVTCTAEHGQGVSADGKTYTFTVQYPTIQRLPQNIRTDITDRTANCGDILQPRQVFAAQGTVSYESSDSEVASVDANTGVITVHKAGDAIITIRAAQTADYQAATTSYKLTVSHKYTGDWKKDDTGYYKKCVCGDKSYATEVPVLGVALDKTSMNLTAGSTGTLIATITPENAKNKSLTWTSDKEAVATVDENGKVTAVAEGTAKITVKTVDGEKTAVCAVTVTAKTSGGSSSGGSSTPTYPVTKPSKTENGSVNISPTSAKRGSIVTITVTPDAGYVLDELTVTDKDGKELSLTKKSDTEYTFVMPAGKVEITPSFVKQAEEPSRVFVDVKTGDYFYDAVLWAVEKGITNGTSAETFSPEAPCTRAQIVTFLWRAAGSPVVNYAMDLSDVAGDAYYAEAVRWALSEGITTGTSDHTFSPDAVCTREQAVTFLWRAAGSPAVSGESAFGDVGADAYYARAVAWAAQNGVTNGISQALFGTGSDCTRAQIVTFLYRAQQGK
ncbi:S-layer homology domain-containing protein [Evtepia sp.]|uniref:S-layer homology domain-containing protein n=1 Tax=Evtepia sp. TaxID=2773933 RepID=UPI002E77D083|nr:S-layer homology domain-containing protein [Evtepia sp.]MEE0257219.1 S-layer homology domain-containing protein [Evtepia sp.]